LRNAHEVSEGYGGAILLEDRRSGRRAGGPLSLHREMWKNGANISLG
jgi:hypothetical protein